MDDLGNDAGFSAKRVPDVTLDTVSCGLVDGLAEGIDENAAGIGGVEEVPCDAFCASRAVPVFAVWFSVLGLDRG